MKLLKLFLSILFITGGATQAISVDTAITANGTPGPYLLGKIFIDTSTIRVSRTDSGFVPQFTYVSSVNGLLFSSPIDSGTPLLVSYQTDYYGISKVYSLYEKRYQQARDTLAASPVNPQSALFASSPSENITVSGYKSVGVSVGSFGQINLEQGLDLQIGGEVRPGTEISAHLNDQGTSLEGTTREISDFDRIFITLKSPAYTIIAGDQYTSWIPDGMLRGEKKIKGLSTSITTGNLSTELFGALSGGTFTIETWRGDKGQGPYALRGNGEPGFITPVHRTVNVTINGSPVSEGEDAVFMVDYDLGTITFTSRRLIKPEDIIRVEYEYKSFDYQRIVSGGGARYATWDSVFSLRGVLWSEADNKNAPIDLALSKDQRSVLKKSGDAPPLASTAYPVNPNNVLDRYAHIPLYTKSDVEGKTVYVYREPDRSDIINNDSLFEVHFTRVDSCGDYSRTVINGEYIYVYEGLCSGDFAPLTPLRAPKRLVTGEVATKLTFPLLTLVTSVVGQERDRNLFSSHDDSDNLASATHGSILLGKKVPRQQGVWLGGDYRYYSSRFDQEALSAIERKESWNDTTISEALAERQLWEASIGAVPVKSISTEMGYGQQLTNAKRTTDKFSAATSFRPNSWLGSSYKGNFFRHFEAAEQGLGHRQQGAVSASFPQHYGELSYKDEWREKEDRQGSGLVTGALNYTFFPINLDEEMSITRFKQGTHGMLGSSDTASALNWNQSINCSPLSDWKLSGSTSFEDRKALGSSAAQKSRTVLVDLLSETGSASRLFSSKQHYRTTAERASRYLQVPTYVGEGRGSHYWDSTLQEYVEDPQGAGNFIISQHEVLDSISGGQTRKSIFEFEWEYVPPPKKISGILGDLAWNGDLSLEEHVDAALPGFTPWLPGYRSLKILLKPAISVRQVRFAELSYRQGITWNPSFNNSLSGSLELKPAAQLVRSFRETSLHGELTLEHDTADRSIEGSLRMLLVHHEDTLLSTYESNYAIRDFSALVAVRRTLQKIFELSISGCAGIAAQTEGATAPPLGALDSTTYFQFTPGAALLPPGGGRFEADYTLSLVNISGNRDYRIARGFASGLSHTITASASMQAGKYFMISGSYRGEIFGEASGVRRPAEHVMSLEVQAILQ